ncbi:MAG: hydantoinase/oxoprolinase family protein [Lautropia sp.]
MTGRYRIGIDIGGTFTDFVLLDTSTGTMVNEKLLTTPDDPSRAVLAGLARLVRDNAIVPEAIAQVIHGTTLVANALIERKGVRTALVTTAGFADVLEVGLEWRYDTYDLGLERPTPLAPRSLCFEVDERVGPDGSVLEPLTPAAIDALIESVRESGVQAVGICLLHAWRDGSHEAMLAKALARRLPEVIACTSSDVVPEIGEYERMSTTLANAYVLPIFDRYLNGIVSGMRESGIARPLTMMLSDGGTVHQETAVRHPVRLVQSGPAGGVQATTTIGGGAGYRDLLCFDMGGTTAKACLIDDGEPLRTHDFEVARVFRFRKGSGLPLRIPVIDMIEIGAGGGSIATIDRLGLLQIGPESTSADPGPACYGRGGRFATVTDADLVLGYLGIDSFLGGDMHLDLAAARAAIDEHVARPLGLTIEAAAWGIHDRVNENMARAAAIHALEKARRIEDYVMIPIGGAGPVHAAQVAAKLGLSRVVCPPGAGVASAFGFLASPTSFTLSRGRVERLDAFDARAALATLDELEAEGRRSLALAGVPAAEVDVRVAAAMRYAGQGYEIDVPIARDAIGRGDTEAIRRAFESTYRQQFGRIEADMAPEIVSWRLVASGPRPMAGCGGAPARGPGAGCDDVARTSDTAAARPAPSGSRPARFGGDAAPRATPVFDRSGFAPGMAIVGPALVEERESTVVVPPGARVHCDDAGNLHIELAAAGAAGRDAS